MKWLLLCGILWHTTFFVFTQTSYRFNNYTINDGLSQSSVTTVLQDNNHSIWIGTQDGLNCFDGRSFHNYISDDTKGLESEYIKCGLKTPDGRLWFGTTNGLTVYDSRKEQFKTFGTKRKIALQIESMAYDQAGKIWIGTMSQGVFVFDLKTNTLSKPAFKIPAKRINAICYYNGLLFLSTEERGLFRVVVKRKEVSNLILPSKTGKPVSVLRIVHLESNEVLFGTNQGLYAYLVSAQAVVPKFMQLDLLYGATGVSDVYKTDAGNWYIATTNKGLFTINTKGKIVNSNQDIFQKNALLFNDINVIFKDDYGTFWLGSERGISSFDPENQGFLGIGPSGNLSRGIPNPNVWSFTEDKKTGLMFIGTDVSVTRFNRRTGYFEQFYRNQHVQAETEAAETAVLSVHAIDANQLLVGCVDGLFELNITSSKSYSFKRIPFFEQPENLKHARIYSIKPFDQTRYLIGTKAGLLIYDIKTKVIRVFEHDPKNPKTSITAGVCRYIYKNKAGQFMLATSTGELNILTEQNGTIQIRPYAFNAMLLKQSKDYITSICQVGTHTYWLGTFGSGLMCWNEKTKKLKRFTRHDGLPNNVVYSVLLGKDMNLWMSTNKGICRFNVRKNKFTNYTETDGLMSNEFNLGAFYKAYNGELFFGGIYGFNYFNPLTLDRGDKDIEVVITKFKFDKGWLKPGEKNYPFSKPIALLDILELSYKQRSFTLHFQASDLSNPHLINYKYILEGSDEGELYIGNSNELPFHSLSPGNYTLKIYARLGDGEWSSMPAVLPIHIRSPFWATWWFISLILIAVFFIVRFFIRNRIEHERREQIRLEMKIAARTKEIRAQNIQIERQRKQLEQEKNKVVEQQKMLQIEKDKTEKLLKNVIPETTAEELKNKGSVGARAYKTVSVMFTDFVGFTKIAEHMDPTELVKRLDIYFTKFDEIIVKNNLEKIKTIGDAYMCAGGVPVRNTRNPIDACLAALQIQDYMRQRKNEAIISGQDYWELRLGINTGEVTAGVIGSERLAFDVWGATVNHAQRMEMLGEPGKVTITASTFQLIEPYFECVFRGKAQMKSSGLIDMYTVERIKPELSKNGMGIEPNERFDEIYNLHSYSSINYYNAERHIMKVLQDGLSPALHYHSIEHTKDVVKAVERIALMEGVTDEGLFLLKSAATYHDAGFVESYEKNESIGARMAEEILPKYGYTSDHIEAIKKLIYVTQIPHKPTTKLEEIICDADLDYLGRDDFHEIADKLRRELKEHGKISSDKQWDEIQVKFISNHRYFTETSRATRRPKKLKNLEEIQQRLDEDQYED
jgi:ligand-binding sensor domain-containing protein/class 3 adenylate cyclase/predicted metal-dependent HD superfamily phosphohydrolase